MMGHRPNHIARLFDHVQNGQPGGIATGQLQGPSGGALGARGKIGGCQDVKVVSYRDLDEGRAQIGQFLANLASD